MTRRRILLFMGLATIATIASVALWLSALAHDAHTARVGMLLMLSKEEERYLRTSPELAEQHLRIQVPALEGPRIRRLAIQSLATSLTDKNLDALLAGYANQEVQLTLTVLAQSENPPSTSASLTPSHLLMIEKITEKMIRRNTSYAITAIKELTGRDPKSPNTRGSAPLLPPKTLSRWSRTTSTGVSALEAVFASEHYDRYLDALAIADQKVFSELKNKYGRPINAVQVNEEGTSRRADTKIRPTRDP